MHLLYTVAIDTPGTDTRWRQACALVRSAYQNGNWTGHKSLIITNRLFAVAPHPDCAILYIDFDPPAAQWSQRGLPEPVRNQIRFLLTLRCHQPEKILAVCPDAEWILYLDSDSVVCGDLQPLLAKLTAEGAEAAAAQELGRNMLASANHGQFIDDPHTTAGERRGMNVGTVFLRGSVFVEFCRQWFDLAHSPVPRPGPYLDSNAVDQSALNKLFCDAWEGKSALRCERLPLSAVAFPLRPSPHLPPGCVIQHLWGVPQETRAAFAEATLRLGTPDFLPKSRDEFPALLRRRGAKLGIEVGVWKGHFSEVLLRSWGGSLICCDRWEPQDKSIYRDNMANVSEAAFRDVLRTAHKRLAPFHPRAGFLRMDTFAAAQLFTDGAFDFVYLDNNHAYEHVRSELDAWWPKVASGGIFAGHDYCTHKFGVKRAVDEWAALHGVTVHLTGEPNHQHPSWFVFKS